ncbi:hypothetical protein [Paenibacillus sp. y28]|uniref:hypothetical protein n=1 Tax=Paenibacillus sp. y28 TaxID=3129110 RepID=UPI003017BCC2
MVVLTGIHWLYLLFVLLIFIWLMLRRDTTIVCIVGILALGWAATGSLTISVSGLFNSLLYALKELMSTVLIISIIVAMSRVLSKTGINETMISPLGGALRSPGVAFWGIGIIMMVLSFFFWPSPAVALAGAVLLPMAIRAGLPAVGAAIAMNLFGHGIALSGDYIIQGAPKLTADSAGIAVSDVMLASIPLVAVMGIVTTVSAYLLLRRDMKQMPKRGAGSSMKLPHTVSRPAKHDDAYDSEPEYRFEAAKLYFPAKLKVWLAVIIPLLFLLDVAALFHFNLQGGDATALVGGTALVILLAVSLLAHRGNGWSKATSYVVDGFQFGFKVFGPVIPIAAFFYLGDAALFDLFGKVLPEGSHGIVNDLGVALAHNVPVHPVVGAVTLTGVGAVTGLDGSGFSGISLVGSTAQLFAAAIGSGIATLTALGQVAAIWVGGGTLIPWALIPAAAICGVDPFELARRNLKPVLIGLAVTTIVAMFLI